MKRLAFILAALALAACGPRPVQYKLATFNVHHFQPVSSEDRAYDVAGEMLRILDPDVVALQELDSCNTRSPEFQAEEIAGKCGLEYLYHRTIPFGGGSYGIGMLYRPSLGLVRSEFLPLPGEEPRGALVAEFNRFVYVCTHFCFQSVENRSRSLAILESWLAERYNDTGKPVFLAGDLNATDILDNAPSWASCSTDDPTFMHSDGTGGRIDYILRMRSKASDGVTLIHSMPMHGAEGLSDHLPVVSFVRIR